MYPSANNHHGDVHGWFPKSYSNMVASNVSSNHGPHATIAFDSDGGIHEEGWFPVTNTRSYGEAALHPLVHEQALHHGTTGHRLHGRIKGRQDVFQAPTEEG